MDVERRYFEGPEDSPNNESACKPYTNMMEVMRYSNSGAIVDLAFNSDTKRGGVEI